MINEKSLKQALFDYIRHQYQAWNSVLIIDELAIKNGLSRIDTAVIGNEIHGFEIKSDFDNLGRLIDQVSIYS